MDTTLPVLAPPDGVRCTAPFDADATEEGDEYMCVTVSTPDSLRVDTAVDESMPRATIGLRKVVPPSSKMCDTLVSCVVITSVRLVTSRPLSLA